MKNIDRDSSYKNHTTHTTHSDETSSTTKHRQGLGNGNGSGDGNELNRSQQANTSRKAMAAKDTATTSSTSKCLSSAYPTRSSSSASTRADHDDQQRTNTSTTVVQGAARRSRIVALQPTLRNIDKAFIDATPTPPQIETAIEICKDWVSAGRGTRITTQSRFWGYMFNLRLDPDMDADHSKNPGVTLCWNSLGNNSSVPFQLQLNPCKFSKANANQLIDLWETLFRFGYQDVRNTARFSRIDEAADAPGLLDDLVFDRKASQTREHYYTRTNRQGLIQTAYIGEATAAVRGTAYDRELAELFRNQQGEVSALNRDTATQVLQQVKGLIRVESRRNLFPKLTYRELADLPSSFSEYNLFDLSRLSRADRLDPAFMYYVELVRLRGLHGAKHRIFELHGKSGETKRTIAAHETRLAHTQCGWWTAMDHTQQLGKLLAGLPLNKFLSKIGSL